MGHARLMEQARDMGYPIKILASSTASYRWQRRLIDSQGVASQWISPQIDIGQGSAFAVFELAVLVCLKIRAIIASEPSAGISLHVDDFSLQAWGQSQQEAAATIIRTATKVVQAVEVVHTGQQRASCGLNSKRASSRLY